MVTGAARHAVELAAAQAVEECVSSAPPAPGCWVLPDAARPGALYGFLARSAAAIQAGGAGGSEQGARVLLRLGGIACPCLRFPNFSATPRCLPRPLPESVSLIHGMLDSAVHPRTCRLVLITIYTRF